MKILIFSDIHGSKEACQELEKILPQFERAVCCGDVVGYGQDPQYCIDFIRKNDIATVKGNHEAFLFGECPLPDHPVVRESNTFTLEKLTSEYLDWLKALPDDQVVEDIYMTHTLGTKYSRYIYDAADIDVNTAKQIESIEQDNIAIGHTHVAGCFQYRGKTIINPSSITKGRRGAPRGYAVYEDSKFELVSLVEELI